MDILLLALVIGALLSGFVFIINLAIVTIIVKLVIATVKVTIALLSIVATLGLIVVAFWFSAIVGFFVAMFVGLVFYSQLKGK